MLCPAGLGSSLPPHRCQHAWSYTYINMSLAEMDRYLDFWNLMSYDFAGVWSSASGHQASLYMSTSNPANTPYAADTAINDYIARGVPARKIVMGLPVYSSAFQYRGWSWPKLTLLLDLSTKLSTAGRMGSGTIRFFLSLERRRFMILRVWHLTVCSFRNIV